MSPRRPRLSYANITSTLALALVLSGGVAVAAGLAPNSVGSSQIKDGNVKTKDLKNNAVKGSKVKDGSLSVDDISSTSLSTISSASFEGQSTDGTLDDSNVTPRCTATATAPSAGFVTIFGSMDTNAVSPSEYLGSALIVDGVLQRFQWWDAGDDDSFYDESNSIVGVVPVSAGQHTFDLTVYESLASGSTYSDFGQCQVTGIFTPKGSAPFVNGLPPKPRP